jgi:hypothetical protein
MIHPFLAAKGPLEQLLSQPQLFVFLFAAVAWVIKAIGKAKGAATKPAAPSPDPARQETFDEARARRVREDILRKVAERQIRRSPAYAPAIPPPLSEDEDGNLPGEIPTWRQPQIVPSVPVKAAVSPQAAPTQAPAPLPVVAAQAAPSLGALWLEELRTRDSVRKAIVLREVLGPPIALR